MLTENKLKKLNHDSLDNLALETFATPLPEGLEKAEKVGMLLEMQAQAEADEQDKPELEDKVNPEPESEPKPEPKKEPTHVYVRIANQEGAAGDKPVFLQVNGYPVLIHRERWVKLRTFFLPSLKHAVETHFFKNEETGLMEEKEVRRFNVEVRTLDQGIPDENSVMDIL